MSDEGIFNKDVSRREAMKTAAKGAAYAARSFSPPPCPPPSPPRRLHHRRTTRRRSSRSSRSRAPPSSSPSPSTPTASRTPPPSASPRRSSARSRPPSSRSNSTRSSSPPRAATRWPTPSASRRGEDLHRPADLHRHPADVGGGLRLRLPRRRPRVLQLGQPQLAQIASQIATVESDHRTLGRAIAGLEPADNWTYAPCW